MDILTLKAFALTFFSNIAHMQALTYKYVNPTSGSTSIFCKLTLSKHSSMRPAVVSTTKVGELDACSAKRCIVPRESTPLDQNVQLVVGMALSQDEKPSTEHPHFVVFKDAVRDGQSDIV